MGNKASTPRQTSTNAINTSTQCPARPAFQRCVDMDLAAVVRRNLPKEFATLWPTGKIPIVYDERYNISFFGIENLHPFDSKKFKKTIAMLESANVLTKDQLAPAQEASLKALEDVHSSEYLKALETSPLKVALVTQLPPLAFLPAFLLRKKVLQPMRLMAGGSVLAGALALERGWAMNMGGGMHHAHFHDGGGWCCYEDITLMLRTLRRASGGRFSRAMIVDVDVHQGNGHERSKLYFNKENTSKATNDLGGGGSGSALRSGWGQEFLDESMPEIFTVDVYNRGIYPLDNEAKAGIDVDVALPTGTEDREYNSALQAGLQEAFERCQPPPQLLVYNAGTDVLVGDPLGRMNVSQEGVIKRDEIVFSAALEHSVPVVMLTSGGYSQDSAPCIARSVQNLVNKFGWTM